MTKAEVNCRWKALWKEFLLLEGQVLNDLDAVLSRNDLLRGVLSQMIELLCVIPEEVTQTVKRHEETVLEELRKMESENRIPDMWGDVFKGLCR